MPKKITYRNYIADFETTVYKGQKDTEVWLTGSIPLDMKTHPDNVSICHSIDGFMNEAFNKPGNKKYLYVNGKFDCSFILPWLYHNGFEAWTYTGKDKEGNPEDHYMDRPLSEMPGRKFKTLIDGHGQWYYVVVHWKNKFVMFQDLLKLLPFSVEALGSAFNCTYRKLDMEYEGKRYAGCEISKEEEEYQKHDVLCVHEALLKFLESMSVEKMTIGGVCMYEFDRVCFHDKEERIARFPNLCKVECPLKIEGIKTADDYIRLSYHGGWTYLKPGKENTSTHKRIYKNGCDADVNSLYPSVMRDNNNVYPYGKPKWWIGEIPEEVKEQSKNKKLYYFVRIRTRFYLKKDHLPTIQIKHDPNYPPRQWLETSDINGLNIKKDENGNITKATVEMVLTQTDFQLLQDHYDLKDLEILDGCCFRAAAGMFDKYIDKWAKVKIESKDKVHRTIAKLMLNNLYGQMSKSDDSSYMIPYLDDKGILKTKLVIENEKDAGHIACGSAITSYARNFTIRHAQDNYKHFIYADTDSLHVDCAPRYLKNIDIHPTAFNCWKIECEWDEAVFVRAKTYIEHNIKEDGEKCDPYYLIKCAGMGKNAKKELERRLLGLPKKDETKCHDKLKISDFHVGLEVEHNLKAKQIPGGTLLVDSPYKMR